MEIGKDFVGISVIFFCHDGQGNYVLARRSANARDEQGHWDVGGGKLEFGEKVEDCLRKEVREEYGAEIKEVEFLGFRDAHREKDGRPTHWVALDFKALVDPAEVKICEPHKFDEIGWFRSDNFPEPMHSQLPIALQNYRKQL